MTRRRIHTQLEALMLCAQFQDGHVQEVSPYLKKETPNVRHTRYHSRCFITRRVAGDSPHVATGWRYYFVDSRVYLPDRCAACGQSNTRVTKTRKR